MSGSTDDAALIACEPGTLGVVYSRSIVHQTPLPELAATVPFVLLLVDLADGRRVMAHGVEGLEICDPVEANVVSIGGRTMLRFGSPSPEGLPRD